MELSIIIISYNTKDLLRQCLLSIDTDPQTQIIVVDNASNDGSSAMVLKEFPQVLLIQSPINQGFAAANNVGLKVATGQYVLLLNSDTQVKPPALSILMRFLKHHQQAGAVTPQVILPDGAIDLACHRGMPTPWNAFTYYTKLESLFPHSKFFAGYHQTYQDFTKPHPVSATAMTAMMLKRPVIDKVGLLDDAFFLYGEDLDYCQRLTDHGYQIWYVPNAVVMHHKSASGKKNRQNPAQRHESIRHFYETMKQFYEKHYQKKYPRWVRQLVYWGIDIKHYLHRRHLT